MGNALYIDDLTSGSRDISEGLEFYQKCKSRFAEGKFNLRKWRTNNIELRKMISHKEGTAENLSGEKVLGITWDENEDFSNLLKLFRVTALCYGLSINWGKEIML